MTSFNRTLYYFLILFIIPIMVFGSCKKEEAKDVIIEEPVPDDRSHLLVDKWWQLGGYYVNNVQQPVPDVVLVRFLALGVFQYRKTGENYDSTWEWANNQQQIVLSPETEFEQIWNVLSLSYGSQSNTGQLRMKRNQGGESEEWVFYPE
jgi:hypothetical protein